ncbi:hypothetical protein H7S28_17595 [Bacillus aerophilus]|nr:hypothetical protein [Bacillus aerophilus]
MAFNIVYLIVLSGLSTKYYVINGKTFYYGDAYSRSHWFAYATGSLAEIVFGSKGAGAIT